MKQQTRLNTAPRGLDGTEEHRSPSEVWGFITGALIVLLLVLAVWFGLGVHNSTTGLDVDVPAAPTEGLEPSD